MENIRALEVFFNDKKVGKLAILQNNLVAFQYNDKWLINGFSISPFSLPLEKKVFIPKIDPFEGLFGVFSDSLPDGWGKLLVDRMLNRERIDLNSVSSLNRLAIVGNSGMGALSYRPEYKFFSEENTKDLDILATACKNLLNTNYSKALDNLFLLGGSSGGARPKILTKIDGEEWLIKFPASNDIKNIGEIEYLYSLCAKKCGITIPETRLFPSKISSGYFGVKRFDRLKDGRRVHMVSVSALLETSHRLPNLDYNILMKLTLQLTNSFEEIEKMFRLMCFNIFAHNRDDHSKNFSFIYNFEKKVWELSPAYDLTYSYSINGEHATTVNGNGNNPNMEDILQVAKNIGMKAEIAIKIAKNIQDIVEVDLNSLIKQIKK